MPPSALSIQWRKMAQRRREMSLHWLCWRIYPTPRRRRVGTDQDWLVSNDSTWKLKTDVSPARRFTVYFLFSFVFYFVFPNVLRALGLRGTNQTCCKIPITSKILVCRIIHRSGILLDPGSFIFSLPKDPRSWILPLQECSGILRILDLRLKACCWLKAVAGSCRPWILFFDCSTYQVRTIVHFFYVWAPLYEQFWKHRMINECISRSAC